MSENRAGFLRRIRVRIRFAWLSATAQRYAPHVGLAVVIAMVVDWMTPFQRGIEVSAGILGVFLFALVLRAATLRISHWEAARAAERGLGARDVLTTALEFTDDADPVHRLIQERAERVAHESRVSAAIPIRPDSSRLRQIAVAGVLALIIGLLPPLGSTPAMSSDLDAALDEEADRIETIADAVEETEVDTSDEIVEELRNLAEELRSAESLEQAMQSIEHAESRLGEQADPNFLSKKAAVQGLARDLALRPLTEDAPLDAASQLSELAKSLDSLSEPERAALADRLSGLAESQSAGNSDLSSQLSEAARALEGGAMSEAARALEQAASEQQSGLDGARGQQALTETQRALEGARTRLSGGGAGQQGEETRGQDGEGDGQGQGQGGGQGAGEGQGEGQGEGGQGQGAGEGGDPAGGGGEITGVAPGDGDASGQGQQGSIGAGNGQDHGTDVETANVFNPLDEGSLSDVLQVDIEGGTGEGDVVGEAEGPTARGESIVPYAQVLPEYLNQAADALGELQLPPSMRGIVQSYFELLANQAR